MSDKRSLCETCNRFYAIIGSTKCRAHTPSEPDIFDAVAEFREKNPPPKKKRQSWDDTWLQCSDVMSRRSRCSRAKVGAVIVAEDQTVISMSYNGPPRGFPGTGSCKNWCPRAMGTNEPSPTYDDCPAAHAEANAIARADYSRMQGATIYVSTSCCKGCAKLLANSGIKRVVFRSEAGREYRRPEETIKFLLECGIEVDEV